LCDARGVAIVPHLRPKHTSGGAGVDPRAAVLDLADVGALTDALRGCTTVMQLIGTMRRRFADGDTYEVSDIGTTRQLVEAGARGHRRSRGAVGLGWRWQATGRLSARQGRGRADRTGERPPVYHLSTVFLGRSGPQSAARRRNSHARVRAYPLATHHGGRARV